MSRRHPKMTALHQPPGPPDSPDPRIGPRFTPPVPQVGRWFTPKVAALISEAMKGNIDALGRLLLGHKPFIKRVCRLYVYASDLDDVVGQTIEDFIRTGQISKLTHPESFQRLLRECARNTARNYYRKKKNGRKRDQAEFDDPASNRQPEDPADVTVKRHDRQEVKEAMKKLPENAREALQLQSEGYSYQEIADRMGVPKASVNNWISRGRKALRDLLREGP